MCPNHQLWWCHTGRFYGLLDVLQLTHVYKKKQLLKVERVGKLVLLSVHTFVTVSMFTIMGAQLYVEVQIIWAFGTWDGVY